LVTLGNALGHVDALTLSTRELFQVAIFQIGDVHGFHRIVNGCPIMGTEHTKPTALGIAPHRDDVFDSNGRAGRKYYRLHHKRNFVFDVFYWFTEHVNMTRTRGEDSGYRLQQCSFAGSVGANNRSDFSFWNGET